MRGEDVGGEATVLVELNFNFNLVDSVTGQRHVDASASPLDTRSDVVILRERHLECHGTL
jgi:hypothetical protein